MAAQVTGSKTVTKAAAPHLTAAYLTTLMATPIELLTVQQLEDILDATKRTKGGDAPHNTIGALLT